LKRHYYSGPDKWPSVTIVTPRKLLLPLDKLISLGDYPKSTVLRMVLFALVDKVTGGKLGLEGVAALELPTPETQKRLASWGQLIARGIVVSQQLRAVEYEARAAAAKAEAEAVSQEQEAQKAQVQENG